MDWLDPTEEQRVVLGVIKYPAKVPGAGFSPVFLNPGVGRLYSRVQLSIRV